MNAITRAPQQQVLRPQTFGELQVFATVASRSNMVPKDYANRPEAIIIAVQMGSEIGLAPMQSLQNIAVINGRPSLWGDAMLALVKAHPAYRGCVETIEGEGDSRVARCEMRRDGEPPIVRTFSVSDAKEAGLWKKAGPWTQYASRMLQMRARGFAVRDGFPDALRGLISAEEARDIPADTFTGPTIEVKVEESSPEARKPTVAEWLDGLEAELTAATTTTSVDAIVARSDVQRAMDSLRNGAKERLDRMVNDAIARTTPDDDFPGDAP